MLSRRKTLFCESDVVVFEEDVVDALEDAMFVLDNAILEQSGCYIARLPIFAAGDFAN
jgi:hypothetical protein